MSRDGETTAMTDANGSGAEALEARLDALEMRLAYQTEAIEDLNSTITEQWKQIDALNRRLVLLTDRLQEAEARAAAGPAAEDEPPPPHY
jgi:SlyX protein